MNHFNLQFFCLQEFQKVFAHEKERFGKSSSGQDPVHHRMDETLSSISLAAEQWPLLIVFFYMSATKLNWIQLSE